MRMIRLIYEPLQKLASQISDITTFQNRNDALQFIGAGIVDERRTMLIPGSGVPTEVYAPNRVSDLARAQLREELHISPDAIVVSMISRVIRTKGVLEFLAAAVEVQKVHSNVYFLLVGPDDQQSVDGLSPDEVVQLKQTVNWRGARDDVAVILAVSDIFVFPSAFREGIPRVLLEAASMGLPIITTDSPGCNEVVEDGVNGFLIPVRNPAALSQAILRLIEQKELRPIFGAASRRRVMEKFDSNLIAEQTRLLYKDRLKKRGLLT